jgi:hypothetical protein
MLPVAISLELIAFAAMFGLGGASLGFAVLALTLLLFLFSITIERRQAQRAGSRRKWFYYTVHDRLEDRPHVRSLLDPGLSGALAAQRWIYLAPSLREPRLNSSRFQDGGSSRRA